MTKIVTTLEDLRSAIRAWRAAGETVGFAPTMGALHAGHLSLVKLAKTRAARTVVSIFVNPLQFAPHEDFEKYPRDLNNDAALLEQAGCDLVFAPSVAEMYPEGFVTKIDPGPLATILEGAVRPGHFSGVATVVVKLLMQVMPDIAVFGEKDYQQLLVIRRVVSDLSVPVEIAGAPIVRDSDGLALSSRNAYLSAEERARALALPQTLHDIARDLPRAKDAEVMLAEGRARMAAAGFKVDYLELRDAETLAPLSAPVKSARLLAAAKIGTTRLIDNVAVTW